MEYTKHLSQFAAQLQYSDLPGAVVEKAKELALHSWGVQLAGSTLPWSKQIYRYTRNQGGSPQSTVLNYGLRTSAANAAFANGTFGHGFEMDDNHGSSGIKGGCVVMSAALAIGEQQLSTGPEFILATVVAYEIMTRIGMAVRIPLLQGARHPTGASAPFGAAAAAGKLLRFDEMTMLHALSIAGNQSAGLLEAPTTGRGNVKRMFGGIAASNGVRAALLAGEGLTGPATILEGEQGFCHAFGDRSHLPTLTAGLGTEWQILRVHYKVYAQDGYLQPMTEALERIVTRHAFKPEDVAEIRAGTNRHAHEKVIGIIREPNDLTSAQFSANFSLALFLVKGGAGFCEYTEDCLSHPGIIDLSKRIRTEVDDEIEREWRSDQLRGARVTVRLKSGAVHSECVHMLREMTSSDVDQKFRTLSSVVLNPDQGEQLLQTVRNLEAVRDVSLLAPAMLRG